MDDFLERPLVSIDLETTDSKIAMARICEIALIKLNTDGSTEAYVHQYFNPTVPMNPEASAVNGLTDEFLKDYATFAIHSKGILDFISGCDLIGHNIMSFDIPVLAEEFLRVGLPFPEPGIKYIDTMILQAKIMPRTLAFAYKHFVGRELLPDQAHGAKYDAECAAEIYMHQIADHGDKLGETRDDLHKISTFNKILVDFAQRIKLSETNQMLYAFGKNEGKTITSDRQYADWMITKGDFTNDTKRWIKHALRFDNEFYVGEKKRAQVEEKEAEEKRKREQYLNNTTPALNFGPAGTTTISSASEEVPADLFPPK